MSGLVLMLAACAGPRADIPVNPENFGIADPVPVQMASEDYRINALDKFKMTVFRVPDLTGDFQVELSGVVNFPLIGSQKVTGLTSAELASQLERAYGARYIRDPQIAINMTEVTRQQVLVGGSVTTPGLYEVVGSSNLLRIVSRAAGPNDTANPSRVIVFRQISGQRNAAAFDYKRISAGLDPNPTIYPGDEIIVDGSEVKAALRDALSVIPLLGVFQAVNGI